MDPLPIVITTFTNDELRRCQPTGGTRNAGATIQVDHPDHGRRWIRLSDWRLSLPPRRHLAEAPEPKKTLRGRRRG